MFADLRCRSIAQKGQTTCRLQLPRAFWGRLQSRCSKDQHHHRLSELPKPVVSQSSEDAAGPKFGCVVFIARDLLMFSENQSIQNKRSELKAESHRACSCRKRVVAFTLAHVRIVTNPIYRVNQRILRRNLLQDTVLVKRITIFPILTEQSLQHSAQQGLYRFTQA